MTDERQPEKPPTIDDPWVLLLKLRGIDRAAQDYCHRLTEVTNEIEALQANKEDRTAKEDYDLLQINLLRQLTEYAQPAVKSNRWLQRILHRSAASLGRASPPQS